MVPSAVLAVCVAMMMMCWLISHTEVPRGGGMLKQQRHGCVTGTKHKQKIHRDPADCEFNDLQVMLDRAGTCASVSPSIDPQ